MSHMVIYRGIDGKPGYHQTDDIHDAVNFVETLRNDEGVEQARIFRLEEVVFEYRPYYRVELSEGGSGQLGSGESDNEITSGSESSDSSEESSISADVDVSDDDKVGAEPKKGLFGR